MRGSIQLYWLFSILSLTGQAAYGQQLYIFDCPAPGGKETGMFKGLLLLDKAGRGFVRLSGRGSGDGKTVLYDLGVNPMNRLLTVGPGTRDSFLYIRAFVLRTLAGRTDRTFSHLDLFFQKNRSTGKFEIFEGPPPFRVEWPKQSYLSPAILPANSEANGVHKNRGDRGGGRYFANSRRLAPKDITPSLLSVFFVKREFGARGSISIKELQQIHESGKPVLHLITVNAAEEMCKKDADDMNDMFMAVASALQIHYKPLKLADKNFHITYLKSAIAGLRCGPDDIIVFTYSGHGFSYRQDDDYRFPQLALWQGEALSKDFLRANSINLEEVYDMLKAKNARLTLVLGDCCNTYVEMRRWKYQPPRPGYFSPRDYLINPRAASNLFLEYKGAWMLAATQKGEKAGSHSWYGGFFSFSFLDILSSAIFITNPPDPRWPLIFPMVSNQALQLSREYTCDGAACSQHMILKQN